MSNPSRRIGTQGEQQSVTRWSRIWPWVGRKGGNAPSDDLAGAPIPIEVKRQATLQIPKWTRELKERHGDEWLLHIIPRDRRRSDAVPELVIMTAEFAESVFWNLERQTEFFHK